MSIKCTTWKTVCQNEYDFIQSQHRWKAESDTTLRPPSASERHAAGMANRTPEKTPHVTSSAAIAPGCLSARWGGRRETQGETEGWVRNKGRKEIQRHGFCGNKTKTRNISKATVKPQMATPKVRQREEGDYYSLAPAHSKSAAPALAACRCCTGGCVGGGAIGEV